MWNPLFDKGYRLKAIGNRWIPFVLNLKLETCNSKLSLDVACHAVVGHSFIVMAGHTPTHGHLDKGFCGRFLTLSDITVTGPALDLSKNDMTTMGEEDMIRLMVKTFPGDLFPLLLELPDLFFFWVFCKRFLVAVDAGGQGGHPGKSLLLGIGMTGEAIHPLLQVLLMIKGDKLFSLRACIEADQDEEE